MNEEKIVLGIDPGLERTGWAILLNKQGENKILDYGLIETKSEQYLPSRLKEIYQSLINIILKYKPNEAALEQLFFSQKTLTQTLTLQARGVILLALETNKIKIYEYNPKTIKKNLTGNGSADKNQMERTIQLIFSLKSPLKPDDISDAVSMALVHIRTSNFKNTILNKVH